MIYLLLGGIDYNSLLSKIETWSSFLEGVNYNSEKSYNFFNFYNFIEHKILRPCRLELNDKYNILIFI